MVQPFQRRVLIRMYIGGDFQFKFFRCIRNQQLTVRALILAGRQCVAIHFDRDQFQLFAIKDAVATGALRIPPHRQRADYAGFSTVEVKLQQYFLNQIGWGLIVSQQSHFRRGFSSGCIHGLSS